jgi:hypothetical protein
LEKIGLGLGDPVRRLETFIDRKRGAEMGLGDVRLFEEMRQAPEAPSD